MSILATCYREAGQHHKAMPLAEEAFTWMKATLGPNHPRTLDVMLSLATNPPTVPESEV